MKFLSIASWILATNLSWAQSILVPTIDTPRNEFDAAIKNLPGSHSITEIYLQNQPSLDVVDELLKRFATANREFLENGNQETSHKKFLEVLELESTADWDKEHQTLFLIAHLRLIQMDTPNKNVHLAFAKWHLLQSKPPTELIPPPVFEQVEHSTDVPTVKIPDVIAKKFSHILVNGKIQPTADPVHIPHLDVLLHITLLSPTHVPETMSIAARDLKKIKSTSGPVINGYCASSQLSLEFYEGLPLKVYTPMKCEQKNQASSPSKEIQLPSIPSTVGSSAWSSRKTWLWIGLGAIASAVVIHQVSEKDRKAETRPTEAHGF